MGTAIQCSGDASAARERLGDAGPGVADERDLAVRDRELLPQEAHHRVGRRPPARVALPAADHEHADPLRRHAAARQVVPHRLGERLDQVAVRRIDVVVVDRQRRCAALGLPGQLDQRVALEQAEVEDRGDHERERPAGRGLGGEHRGERVARRLRGAGLAAQARDPDLGREPQDRRGGPGHRRGLGLGARPRRIVGREVGDEQEQRPDMRPGVPGHAVGATSRPPIRSCFTMVARTSTIARTASSAVMSE